MKILCKKNYIEDVITLLFLPLILYLYVHFPIVLKIMSYIYLFLCITVLIELFLIYASTIEIFIGRPFLQPYIFNSIEDYDGLNIILLIVSVFYIITFLYYGYYKTAIIGISPLILEYIKYSTWSELIKMTQQLNKNKSNK